MATVATRPDSWIRRTFHRSERVGTTRPDLALLLGEFGSGGVERVGCLLMNGFSERGMSTEVLTVHTDGANAGLLSPSIGIRALGGAAHSRGNRGLALLRSIPAIAAYLGRVRPRVFVSPGNHTHVAAAIAHRLAGGDSQLVLKITNPLLKGEHGLVARIIRRSFYRWAFRRAAAVLVLSPHGYRQAAEIDGSALDKIVVVHNPYVAKRAPPSAPPPEASPPMILAVGRLTPQKNHALLLRALARIADRPWRLVLLGEGPLEGQLRALAASLGIADRIEFAGFVADPTPYYDEAHLMALSSQWEDLPAVVVEALAIGLPVVATACSDAVVTVMTAAEVGSLVRPCDDRALAEAVAAVIDQPWCRVPFAGAALYDIDAGVDDHLRALRPLLGPAGASQRPMMA